MKRLLISIVIAVLFLGVISLTPVGTRTPRADSAKQLWGPGGICICHNKEELAGPCIAPDGAGGAIVAWSDERTGVSEIYAQRVAPDGEELWTKNGRSIAELQVSNDGYASVNIVSDCKGGAVVAWHEYRSDTPDTARVNLYAQRIDGNGNCLWGSNGVQVSNTVDDQDLQTYRPSLVADGSGGAYFSWLDNRTFNPPPWDPHPAYTYAQHLNSAGAKTWGSGGVKCINQDSYNWHPGIARDDSGGIFIWEDFRIQKLNSSISAEKLMH
jgi:hypothetical protein